MKRIISLLFSFVFLTFISSSVFSETESTSPIPALEQVSLQLKWKPQFQFAGYYAALEQGFYEDAGLDVTILPISENVDVIQNVVSGEVTYAIGGSGILAYYANGTPIKALAAIFQHDALIFVTKQSSGIISPYEMKGKRIMFDALTGDDAPLRAVLSDVGLEKDDYTLVTKTYNNDALINNEIDVMSTYITNQPFELRKSGIAINIINPQNYGFDFYGDILYTSQSEVDNNPARAARFRKASIKGWEYALSHQEELIQLLKNKYDSRSTIESLRNEAKETVKLIIPDIVPIGTIDYSRLRRVAQNYTKQKLAKPLSEKQLKEFIFNTTIPLKLSIEEQKWLDEHPVIRVGIDSAYAPYEWVDENGHYVGISADYIHLIENKLGLRFEIVKDKPWHELIDQAKSGDLDMFACMNSTPERGAYLNFSPVYVENPMVIVNATRNGYIGRIDKLKGKIVAIEQDYFMHDNLVRDYPEIKLLVVNNTVEALTKVSTGEADAFIGDAAYADYTIKKAGLLNLQFSGSAPGLSSYRFGISQRHPELLTIMTKALKSISPVERAEIEKRWMGLSVSTGVATITIIKISIGVFILFIVIFFRHYQVNKSRKILQKVQKELHLYGKIYQESHEATIITDANQIIIDVNPAFYEITGYNREEAIGKKPRMLSSGKHSPEFYVDMWQSISEDGFWHGEVWNRKKSGVLYAEALSIYTIHNEEDNSVNYVGLFTDITTSKRQQEKLNLMAHYDVLTQLPNRALLADRFQQAIAYNKRLGSMLAVCFLDLDKFKPVNDSYGHDVGDKLLIEVAERIQASIREGDTVSRQGGDEFAILLNNIESFKHCEITLKRIHEALSQPYLINDISLDISASTGVALFPEDGEDIDTLLRHADQAMYQSKQSGRNQYHRFNTVLDQEAVLKHHKLGEIEAALNNNEMELYYQPKVNMATGQVIGAEALIRWNSPENGLIRPLEFLPSVDGTQLEIDIGNWAINDAIKQIDAWNRANIFLNISINIASYHLLSDGFVSQLDTTLAEYPSVAPSSLQLEILESSALGDLNSVSHIIKTCQEALGVKIALDDFGTGYSSLTHLRNLPTNTIKIDQSFVRDILDDPSDYVIVDGIIGLADAFSREVIAEGIETDSHGLMLLLMGCEEAQGYGIAKPMPAKLIPQWLEDYRPNEKWLSLGKTNRTDRENKLELFRLLTEHWNNSFINNIQLLPETVVHWPIMDGEHCSCGAWFAREKQEALFRGKGLNQLDKAHDKLHLVAYNIYLQYQNGEMDTAREGLAKFHLAYKALKSKLELLK